MHECVYASEFACVCAIVVCFVSLLFYLQASHFEFFNFDCLIMFLFLAAFSLSCLGVVLMVGLSGAFLFNCLFLDVDS